MRKKTSCLKDFLSYRPFLLFIVGRSSSQYLGNGDFWEILRKDIMLSLLAGITVFGFYVYKRKKHYEKYVSELQNYLAELR